MRIPRGAAAPVAAGVLRAFGFWKPPPLTLDAKAVASLHSARAAMEGATAEALHPPGTVTALELLRWLAATTDVLFHGSGRDDLEQLSPVRQSSDTREFGNQQAVFATPDPVWAMFFAVLDRTRPELTSTRNGTATVVGRRRSFGPRYFFSVNEAALGPRLWRAGTVYVLARDGFEPEPREMGVIDTGQWASRSQVNWLAKVRVEPDDFPFAAATFGHMPGESQLRTYARIRRANSG